MSIFYGHDVLKSDPLRAYASWPLPDTDLLYFRARRRSNKLVQVVHDRNLINGAMAPTGC